MCFKIKIIEISDDLKSKSNHDFDFKIMILILKSKSCPSLRICISIFNTIALYDEKLIISFTYCIIVVNMYHSYM